MARSDDIIKIAMQVAERNELPIQQQHNKLHLWSILVRYGSIIRRFALPSENAMFIDVVRREFFINVNVPLALAIPHSGGLENNLDQGFVVIPFDYSTVLMILKQVPDVIFDLRVYAAEQQQSMIVTSTGAESEREEITVERDEVVCLYDFDAADSQEISFKTGDVLKVIGKFNDDWYSGKTVDGAIGYFPSNYVSGLEDISRKFDSIEGSPDWQDPEYFESYNNMSIHFEMLKDISRTQTYKDAIFSVDDIQGKVILDVGCGTSVLSCFCALAGAKHVYAVEASNFYKEAQKVINANGLSDKITLINGKLEDITLPEKVDAIVSEWMGTMLICESMFSSVIYARDTFLKPNGLMLPATSDIYLVPLHMSDLVSKKINFWDDVYGVDMTCLKEKACTEFFASAIFDRMIETDEVLAAPANVLSLDMSTVCNEDLDRTEESFTFSIEKDGVLQGFGTWFDTGFKSASEDEKFSTVLSTSYEHEPTHWRNVCFVLKDHFNVNAGMTVTGKFIIERHPNWLRHFEVEVAFSIMELNLQYSQRYPLWR